MCSTEKININPEVKKQKDNKVDESKLEFSKLEEKIKQLRDREEKLLYMIAEMKNEEAFSKKLNESNNKRFKEKIIKKILTVVDSLNIAVKYLDKSENPEVKNHLVGLKMILKKTEEDFGAEGLKKIEVNPLKDNYDRTIHKATKIDKKDKYPDGIILELEKEGYYFEEKILREAEVKVNKIK